MNPRTFGIAVLNGLGITPTPQNVRAMVGWVGAEGGHWHNDAKYNPLNTTQNMPGAGNTGTQGDIKVYRSWRQGIEATVKTLQNGHYAPILHALRQGSSAEAVGHAIGQTPWGTSGLVNKTIGSTAAQSTKGGKSSAGSSGGGTTTTTTRISGDVVPGFDPGNASGAGLAEALRSAVSAKPQVPVTTLAAPSFSAAPKLPAGYQPVDAGMAPVARSSRSLSDALASAVGSGQAVDLGAPQTPKVTTSGVTTPVSGASVHASAPGHYVNPHPRGLVAPGRVDEGTDPTIAKGAPIVAVGNAKVVNVSHNFYKNLPYIVYQLLDGPRKGQYVYVSEYVTPTVKVGQHVRAGQTVARGTGRAIEEGFAGGPRGSYLPLANHAQGGSYTEGKVTKQGLDWAGFSKKLGARTAR